MPRGSLSSSLALSGSSDPVSDCSCLLLGILPAAQVTAQTSTPSFGSLDPERAWATLVSVLANCYASLPEGKEETGQELYARLSLGGLNGLGPPFAQATDGCASLDDFLSLSSSSKEWGLQPLASFSSCQRIKYHTHGRHLALCPVPSCAR